MKSLTTIVALGAFWLVAFRPFDSLAEDKDMNRPTIQHLIEALANKNAPPAIIKAKQAAQFPPDYDWAEQARVISVWEQLHNRAEEALPDLVAHAGDKEYCVSYPHYSSGAWYNNSVGNICWYILDANVSVSQRPTERAFFGHLPKDHAKLREWWDEHKDMSLADIQLEAITETRKTHLTRTLSPMDGPATEKDRKKDIELLDKLAEQIKETGKPISVKAISRRETAFENYPWPPKK